MGALLFNSVVATETSVNESIGMVRVRWYQGVESHHVAVPWIYDEPGIKKRREDAMQLILCRTDTVAS